MKTEELIQIWQNQDAKIEKNIQVNQYLLQSVTIDKVKSTLNLFRRSNIFELIANALFLFWMISVIERLIESTPLLLSFGILSLLMIGSIIFNIRKLLLVKSINYNISIIQTQAKLERLKLYEIYETNALLFAIPITAIPFILVLGKGILYIDIYSFLSPIFLIIYFFGSLLIGVIIVWILKLSPNPQIQNSINFINEINDFEK